MPDHQGPHRSRLNEGVKWASDVVTGAGRPGGKQSSSLGDGEEFDVGLCLRATSCETVGMRFPGWSAPFMPVEIH